MKLQIVQNALYCHTASTMQNALGYHKAITFS